MTIQRTTPGEVEWRLSVFRDETRLATNEGAFNLVQFCRGFQINEDMSLATMEAEFIFEDAAGLQTIFTGSEILKLEVFSSTADRVYHFRSYGTFDRVKATGAATVYSLRCMSVEFLKNESINVFGSSEVLFNNNTSTENIVETLMKSKNFIGTKKNVFVEDTISNHSFIIPNWRPLDVIYWMTNRTIRKSSSGGQLQNGFVFYENALGYNFRSIDGLIEDANKQSNFNETDPKTDVKRLYEYVFAPKQLNEELDIYTINGYSFPEENCSLLALRHGSFSGYSVGFDPINITTSAMGLSEDIPKVAYEYSVADSWEKMEHLQDKSTTNPINFMDKEYQSQLTTPRRVRYCMLPNQAFDPKYKDNPLPNYQELVELQSYQYMRMETMKNLKLKIAVPGNLDLYVGGAINVSLPATVKRQDFIDTDDRYSGRYIITKLTHSGTVGSMQTELLLMKDSILK